MSQEITQYLIYAGLMVGGFLLRHFGIPVPLLPGGSTPRPPSPTAASDVSPTNVVGTPTGPLGKTLADFIESRLKLLEDRLESRTRGGEGMLNGDLIRLAAQILDRAGNAGQGPAAK